MSDDTDEWLQRTPVEALLCRDLRHAWPRPTAGGRRKRGEPAGLPPASPNIVWKVISAGSDTAPRVLERTMSCTAGCGVRRVETFVVRSGGRLVRTGKPKMRYPSWYQRKRAEPDRPLDHLDPDVVRGNIVARLYPGLKW